MSYDLRICVPPVPDNDKAAWAHMDAACADEVPAAPLLLQFLDQITKKYPCICDLPDDEVDDGVWSDGPLRNNAGQKVLGLGIVFSRVDEVLPFVLRCAAALGLVVFDPQTDSVHRGSNMKGLALTVEDQKVRKAPTRTHIVAAVDQLTPDGGPGFLILEGRGEDYAQAAGGNGTFTVEWREFSDEGFQHFIAGYAGKPARKNVKIACNGFDITVKQNEALAAEDAKNILLAFAAGSARPADYAWRDVTERFTSDE